MCEFTLDRMNQKLIGRNIVRLDETDSTNTQALNLALEGCDEGTVVTAREQHQGRGRLTRTWFSPPGMGLYVSVVLYPSISLTQVPRVTLMTAVAAVEAIKEAAGLQADIKWPNDLLLNNKKVCGILTEMHYRDQAAPIVIVGIGINVNTPAEMFPPEIQDIAASLFAITGEEVDKEKLFQSFISQLDRYYALLVNDNFSEIINKWRASSTIVGRKVTTHQDGMELLGEVTGVDDNGILILKDEQGNNHAIIGGEIFYTDTDKYGNPKG